MQRPGDVSAMAELVIRCKKRDLAVPLKLTLDLAMQGPLVGLFRQEEVGALLLELLNNGFRVCKASAWMNKPWRFSSPSSVLSTARAWFSPVAWQAWLRPHPARRREFHQGHRRRKSQARPLETGFKSVLPADASGTAAPARRQWPAPVAGRPPHTAWPPPPTPSDPAPAPGRR